MSEQTYKELILMLTNEARQRQLTDLEAGILRSEGQVAELKEQCRDLLEALSSLLKRCRSHKEFETIYPLNVQAAEAALAKAQPSNTSVTPKR